MAGAETAGSEVVSLDLSAFLTPDGRWNLLQDWLDEHPRNKAVFEMWLRMPAEESFPQIREAVAEIATKKWGQLAGALVRTTQLTPDIKIWIESLQTLYIERKGDEKHVQRRDEQKDSKRGFRDRS